MDNLESLLKELKDYRDRIPGDKHDSSCDTWYAMGIDYAISVVSARMNSKIIQRLKEPEDTLTMININQVYGAMRVIKEYCESRRCEECEFKIERDTLRDCMFFRSSPGYWKIKEKKMSEKYKKYI